MASELLDEIVELIGLPHAVRLCRRFGGRAIYVPATDYLKEDHPIALAIGHEPAKALAKIYGSQRLAIPSEVNALLKLRNQAIVQAYQQDGVSISKLAETHLLDRRMIQKILDAAGVVRRSDDDPGNGRT